MLALRERLLSGGAWALAGKVATALIMLLANVLLARLLAPQDLGVYFLAFSVVQIGALLGSLGLNWTAVRLIAESTGLERFGQARRVVEKVLFFGLLGALGIGAGYVFAGMFLGNRLLHVPALADVTFLVAAWMVVTALQVLLAEVFRGFHDIRFAMLFGGLATWTLLAAGLALLWLVEDQSSLFVVLLVATGAGLANVLLAVALLSRRVKSLPADRGEDDEMGSSEILRIAWPLLVTNLSIFALSQADIWIIGASRPPEEVAVYGAAARLVILIAMPLAVANAVIPPVIAEMHARGSKRELERVLRTVSTLSGVPAFAVLVGFIVLGGPILGLTFGEYYREGAVVLAVLSLGQLVNVWAGSCGQVLMMTGHQRAMMTITAACGVLSVGAGLMVVEPYGATGVAVTVAAGLILQNALMWMATRAYVGVWAHVEPGALLRVARDVRRWHPRLDRGS